MNQIFEFNMISELGVKMNFRIITKNHAADPEKEFLKNSISKPYGPATVMPPARELNKFLQNFNIRKKSRTWFT